MTFFSKSSLLVAVLALMCLTACSGTGVSPQSPWEKRDYRRQAEGAPNQLSQSSLSNPDLFYSNTSYTVQKLPKSDQTNPDTDNASSNLSKIPYEHFRQTLEDFSRQQQESGQAAMQDKQKRQDFLGAKLPEDPGTAPGLPSDKQTRQGLSDRSQANSNDTVIKAALLVPLSGEHRHIGKAMLRSAETALFNIGAQNFEILPQDTAGDPGQAQKAAISAIDEGADIILGPLFGHSTAAIKNIARRHDIKIISFTTDWAVADNNTFVMGFLPFTQVHKILEHAATQGLMKLGVLAPDTKYGNAVVKAFQSRAPQLGLETIDIARFSVGSSNISPVIREFTNYDARVEELNQKIRPLKEELEANPDDQAVKEELSRLEAMDTAGEPPFDAVLMPIGGEQLKAIANLLSFYDLDPEDVTRLGTGLWDDPALATEPNLEGGRFATSSPLSRKSFENQYKKLYGVSPPRLSTLAYDATALAVVLGRHNLAKGYDTDEIYRHKDMINPNGYAGIDGIFRFHPNGLVERGLAISMFQDKDIVIVEPAPETFEKPRGF